MRASGRAAAGAAFAVAVVAACAWYGREVWKGSSTPPTAPAPKGQAIDAPVETPTDAPAPDEPPGPAPQGEGHVAVNHEPADGPALQRTPESEKAFPLVTFDTLAAFTYVQPPKRREGDPERPQQIPADILKLDGGKVCVIGYMMPTDMEEDRILGFLLMRTVPQCCFGVAPMVNEWIVVTMDPKAPPPDHKLTPIAVEGVLEVGEKDVEGWVESVYRMKATRVLELE